MAQPYTVTQAKALALTALDVMCNPESLMKVQDDFTKDMKTLGEAWDQEAMERGIKNDIDKIHGSTRKIETASRALSATYIHTCTTAMQKSEV